MWKSRPNRQLNHAQPNSSPIRDQLHPDRKLDGGSRLSGTDESGYVVQQGDRVDFTGQVAAHDPGFATQVGVDAAEGADQLGQQGAHVEVAKSELRRSAA